MRLLFSLLAPLPTYLPPSPLPSLPIYLIACLLACLPAFLLKGDGVQTFYYRSFLRLLTMLPCASLLACVFTFLSNCLPV